MWVDCPLTIDDVWDGVAIVLLLPDTRPAWLLNPGWLFVGQLGTALQRRQLYVVLWYVCSLSVTGCKNCSIRKQHQWTGLLVGACLGSCLRGEKEGFVCQGAAPTRRAVLHILFNGPSWEMKWKERVAFFVVAVISDQNFIVSTSLVCENTSSIKKITPLFFSQ